jgi:hypothetical protein
MLLKTFDAEKLGADWRIVHLKIIAAECAKVSGAQMI